MCEGGVCRECVGGDVDCGIDFVFIVIFFVILGVDMYGCLILLSLSLYQFSLSHSLHSVCPLL